MPAPSATAVNVRPRSLGAADIAALATRFERSDPTTIIEWAAETFGTELVLTASFADTLMIDLATRVVPDIEVVFLDTGFHFAETLDTVRRAMVRYELNLTVLRPDADAADPWAAGTDTCCRDRKTAPLDRHLSTNARAWLSGLRRDDHAGRADTPVVGLDRRGLVKINPIATWSDAQVADYSRTRDIIVNPLTNQGYPSIGCWPCTEPVAPGADPRAGRWSNSTKTECGLHL